MIALVAALERIKRWMIDHQAPMLVKNLAGGATASELDAVEATLGFRLPADLRDLWRLHHGQKEEMNGFAWRSTSRSSRSASTSSYASQRAASTARQSRSPYAACAT